MTRQLNSMLLIITLCLIGFACHFPDNKVNNSISSQDNNYIDKIAYFVKEYDFYEDDSLYFSNKEPYFINDSLSYYLSKLSNVDKDNKNLKFVLGNFLEKKYLHVREMSKKPNTFPVYNVSIWARQRESFFKALKIVNDEYAGDFVCIDSITLKLDKLVQFKNDSIHKRCMDLVKNKNTGGCIW